MLIIVTCFDVSKIVYLLFRELHNDVQSRKTGKPNDDTAFNNEVLTAFKYAWSNKYIFFYYSILFLFSLVHSIYKQLIN